MSARLTRKDMKRDELREGLGSAALFLRDHGRSLAIALGALLVGVAALAGYSEYSERREQRASEKLAEALEVLRAPLEGASSQTPPDPDVPTFPDEASRTARAQDLLTELRKEHLGTDAGDISLVYLAEFAAQKQDYERARGLWEEFLEEQGDHMLAAEVQVNLMSLDRTEGHGEELVTEIESLLESPEVSLPNDVLLYQLAITLEDLGRKDEAQEAYQQIVTDYPGSPYLGEARAQSGEPSLAPRSTR